VSDDQKVASQRIISRYEVESYPGAPSAFFLHIESLMVAEIARLTHAAGRKFTEWPRFEVRDDSHYSSRPEWALFAETNTVPTR
jgi:hypothetical protein